MASGVAVLTTDIPGCRDLIRHGENGWLTPPSDPQHLAEAMVQLLSAPELRKTLAANARDSVQRFSMKGMAGEYARLYETLVARLNRLGLAE
jgi:glycosyltransferase involved in cell wall biosynthesis